MGAKQSKRNKRPKAKRPISTGIPTDEESAAANFVHFNCPNQTTTVGGETVAYFLGSDAVDCLMKSKWSSMVAKNNNVIFHGRQSVVIFMQWFLERGTFYRVKKLVLRKKKPPTDDGSEEERPMETRKRKFRLVYNPDQIFKDDRSIYVWKYAPTTWTNWLIGLGILIGLIACYLFPLFLKKTKYLGLYQQIVHIVILILLSVTFIRPILFLFVWIITFGRIHFWLFPNLFQEQFKFRDSFWPVYSFEFVPFANKTFEKSKKSASKDQTEAENFQEEENNQTEDGDQENEAEKSGNDHKSAKFDKIDGNISEHGSRMSSDEEISQEKVTKKLKKRRVQRGNDDGSSDQSDQE